MQPEAGGWLRLLADALDCWRVYLPVLASLAGSVAILNVGGQRLGDSTPFAHVLDAADGSWFVVDSDAPVAGWRAPWTSTVDDPGARTLTVGPMATTAAVYTAGKLTVYDAPVDNLPVVGWHVVPIDDPEEA